LSGGLRRQRVFEVLQKIPQVYERAKALDCLEAYLTIQDMLLNKSSSSDSEKEERLDIVESTNTDNEIKIPTLSFLYASLGS
jgi:hypothetical protein